MTLETVREFLGWCTLINFGLIGISSAMIFWCRGFITRFHGKQFGMEEADLRKAYFKYLANFKLMIIVFNLVPYLALRIMG